MKARPGPRSSLEALFIGCQDKIAKIKRRPLFRMNPDVLTFHIHFQFDESFLSKYALIQFCFAEGAMATLATGTVMRSA